MAAASRNVIARGFGPKAIQKSETQRFFLDGHGAFAPRDDG